MKTLKINVPEGYKIDKEKSTFEEIVFKEIVKKYPTGVKEIEGRIWCLSSLGEAYHAVDGISLSQVSTEGRANEILAVTQLVELRDAWNKIDGFEVDWENDNQEKYCIFREENKIETDYSFNVTHLLYFGSPVTRDKFLEQFRDLIDQAGEFVN